MSEDGGQEPDIDDLFLPILAVVIALIVLVGIQYWLDYPSLIYYGASTAILAWSLLMVGRLSARFLLVSLGVMVAANVASYMIYRLHVTSPDPMTLALLLRASGAVGLAVLLSAVASPEFRGSLVSAVRIAPVQPRVVALVGLLLVSSPYTVIHVVNQPLSFERVNSGAWQRSEVETKLSSALAESNQSPVAGTECLGQFPAQPGQVRTCLVTFELLGIREYQVLLSETSLSWNRVG